MVLVCAISKVVYPGCRTNVTSSYPIYQSTSRELIILFFDYDH